MLKIKAEVIPQGNKVEIYLRLIPEELGKLSHNLSITYDNLPISKKLSHNSR
jgi:hypothetical protein